MQTEALQLGKVLNINIADIENVSNLRCPNCGKEVPPHDQFFCPFCGKSLVIKSPIPNRQTKLPMASGILTIVASVILLAAGAWTIIEALNTYGGFGYGFIDGTNVFFWASGSLFIIAFAIGLTGSIFQIRKKQILIATFSVIPMIVSAAILVGQSNFVITFKSYYSDYTWQYVNGNYLYLAIPIVVLSILSLIFIGVSRKEFKP